MNKTVVVNLFAGPDSGKSTTCAAVFSELKYLGVNCEIAPEYVKDKVWEESFKTMENQFYITAKQHHRVHRLNGKVDVVITDSPFLQSVVYYQGDNPHYIDCIKHFHNEFNNLNFFIERKKKYLKKGRTQTLEQAKELDSKILGMLEQQSVKYHSVPGERDSIQTVTNTIMKKLWNERHNGKIVVVAGPSGIGKTTVVNKLVETNDEFEKVKTTTTRNIRDGEKPTDYDFVTIDEFSKKIKDNQFLEWEEVYDGVYYGSCIKALEEIWSIEKLPIMITDVKGAVNIKQKMGDGCLSVFLNADKDTIVQRLENRQSESESSLKKRISRIDMELSFADKFDIQINNYNLDDTLKEIRTNVDEHLWSYDFDV